MTRPSRPEGALLAVRVQPRAQRSAVEGWRGGALPVRVTAAPTEGRGEPRGDRPARGRLRRAGVRRRAGQRGPRPRQALPRRRADPRRPARAARPRPRMISPIRWDGERLVLLDQTRLPTEEIDQACASWQEVAHAIKTLVVRGAPAIGVAAAFGVALAARQSPAARLGRLRRRPRAGHRGARRHAAHRGQPLLGARPHAPRRGRASRSARRPREGAACSRRPG